jgi:hypothetical protein
MKKVILFLVVMAAVLLTFFGALAEVDSVNDLPTEPFTWEYLATIGGATLATMLIVQLLKLPLDKVWKIPTRIIVFVIAAIVLLLATHFTVGLTAQNALLTIINAVIVALAAMGGYELTFAKLENK